MTKNIDNELDQFTRDVGTTIMRLVGKFRHSGIELVAEVELSQPQAMVLIELLDSGTITMGELSKRLQITHGVVTRIVDRLLEKGMVTRERDANDRRVVLVSISKEGRNFAEKMIDYHLEKMRSIFVGISRRDREEFLSFLQKIDRQMG